MVPKKQQQGVRVLITTYKTGENSDINRMNVDEKNNRRNTYKYVCSICLKARDKNYGKGICMDCQERYNNDISKYTRLQSEIELLTKSDKLKPNIEEFNKPKADYDKGLNLLNEVLTVFKNNKQHLEKVNSSKTVIFKNVSTCTDSEIHLKMRSKLVLSKVFLCSIDGKKDDEKCKFAVVNSCQPEYSKKEDMTDLKRHKSSSIPQMRMEELKNLLKEKTKSKDITEEVKRMFATVNIDSINNKLNDGNRPETRKGPRVLPVVKNKTNRDISIRQSCKCCQTSEYCLSSGDSSVKPNLMHDVCRKVEYTSCCHCLKNHRLTQTDILLCQHCNNIIENRCECDKNLKSYYKDVT